MKKIIAFAPLMMAAVVASPAFAQDSGFDRDSHFDGPYISVGVGLASQPNDIDDSVVFDTNGDGVYTDTVRNSAGANAFVGFCNGRATTPNAGTRCSNDKDRIEYKGRVGYDIRSGNIVFGGLIEGSGNNILDGTTGFSSTPTYYELTREVDYTVNARARVGYTPNGGALFYATGGLGMAKINHSFRTGNTANTFTENNDDSMVWGYQYGGGAEIMLTDNISLGAEYLFNRYKDDKYYVQVGQGTAGATNPFVLSGNNVRMQPSSENFTWHTFSATMSFRF